MQPGYLDLRAGSDKRANGSMGHLCGELAFGQRE
jgi:hypothetical protein